MNIYAFIFARGGSKGVPGKNIRSLAGKPLLAHSIEIARQVSRIQKVFVSTEDEDIAKVAREWDANVIIRPAELAQDDSPEWLAWQHAIKTVGATSDKEKIDVFVCIPTTSPLRASEDIDACIETLLVSDADLVITVKKSDRNPYFNMVMLDEDGYAQLALQPEERISHRQDAPCVYDMTTVAYAARPGFILKAGSMFDGKVKAVVIPAERAIDIDTEMDFVLSEFLLKKSYNS